jgi:hypothetical protein
MKKIRLNNTHRDLLRQYGQDTIAALIDRKEEKALYAKLIDGANKAIRKKYPEEHMVVLRQYDLATINYWLKFQFPSGRVDGFSFDGKDPLADMPSRYRSDDVYPVSEAFEKAFDDYAAVRKLNQDNERTKYAAFESLISSAKTVEDVMEVIELPPDLLERFGRKCTALVALSRDDLTRLKKDFALSKAA